MRGVASKVGKRWTAALIAGGLIVVALGAGAFAQASGMAAGILKVRLGGDTAETRLVIDLDRSVSAKLISDGALDNTVVVAFPKVGVASDIKGAGQGVVRRWTMQSQNGGARINIELAQQARVARRFLLPPGDGVDHYRYVIDLRATGGAVAPRETAALSTRSLQVEQAVRRAPTVIRADRPSGRKVIVIDAGHGGHDPGAIGQNVHEKVVTLATAKALKARLEKTGRYTVILTRDTDRYVTLEGRVQIARRADADLFISLHADAGPESVNGASVYTLSEKGEGRVGKVLAKDDWLMNASLTGGDRGVGQILLDLSQRATKNRSAVFAEMLVSEISDVTPMLRRSHRDGNLIVLLAPDVPAVLLEMGFITSASDEARLTSATSRARLVGSIGDAIDRWFSRDMKIASR
ncbi:MAG: N-acetylmuramoyl-L-alanine amidase [Caulobacteraceae bacterium]|nr:MAG: N-acetylmuramoyl-L-alanine amidase [Caulobacteraceae bacterium]